jgi:hypothetical protein
MAAITLLATTSVLVADAVVTQGWTLTRQNIRTALGRGDCGLADQMVIIAEGGLRGLAVTQVRSASRADRVADRRGFPAGNGFGSGWYYHYGGVAPPLVLGLDTFGSRPPEALAGNLDGHLGSFRSPWYRVPRNTETITVLVIGGGETGLRLGVQFATTGPGSSPGGELTRLRVHPYSTVWRPVQIPVPSQATAVRLLGVDAAEGSEEGWVAVSQPAVAATTTLGAELRRTDAATLANPALALYLPCARQPSIAAGVVEIPKFLVVAMPTWFGGGVESGVFAPVLRLEYHNVYLGGGEIAVLRSGDLP